MKTEDAVRRIRLCAKYDVISQTVKEAMEMGTAALEKQIPKEPTPETVDKETGAIAGRECPSCGRDAIGKPEWGNTYCPWCGQRLKWEGTP